MGERLPPWTPGLLDIHQINTGRGNAALLIFPDGTSLLIDAGDGNPEPPRGATRAPDTNLGQSALDPILGLLFAWSYIRIARGLAAQLEILREKPLAG